ncbi:hypothetical protein N7533_003420 [Penicillium manginii]|uniref:uncharacterized protein n=1 Tax=Penicillium manginii TaxID=203109 RepID=UPI00254728B1|nr:uncharacterized protein N7533_003420 [Penicillium manginii]KAJ5761381.1 hypothetical protein N7533_003420 [Penicillium manginii]
MRLSNSDTDIEACFTCSILLAELERIGVSIKTNHETVWASITSLQTHIDALIQQKPAQSDVFQVQGSKSKASPELVAQDLPRQAKPPRPSLPHPERFTGNKSLGAWDAAIRGKLAVDGQAIGIILSL